MRAISKSEIQSSLDYSSAKKISRIQDPRIVRIMVLLRKGPLSKPRSEDSLDYGIAKESLESEILG